MDSNLALCIKRYHAMHKLQYRKNKKYVSTLVENNYPTILTGNMDGASSTTKNTEGGKLTLCSVNRKHVYKVE